MHDGPAAPVASLRRLQSWRSGAAELARIAADERASVRSPGTNGARESELRSTSGMISSVKRGQLVMRHRPGLIILSIKLNNQNDILEIASRWS